MFWSKKKIVEDIHPPWWLEWIEMKGLFYIGKTFKFCGIVMVVRSHTPYIPPVQRPSIDCSYADNNGIIHDYTFYMNEWEFLKTRV